MRLKFYVQLWLTAILAFAFTIAKSQAPTITSFNPTSGPVGSLVTIAGTNLSNPTSVSFGGVTAIVVSNSASEIKAMVMPSAISGSINLTTGAGSVNSVGLFTVTSSSTPNTPTLGTKLEGAGAIGNAYQGRSVAISADGNTAAVGGFLDNTNIGAIWVFIKSGANWTQQGGKLIGSGASTSAQQGASLAISADGNTIILGGNSDNVGVGAVWVFTRSNGVWTQQGNKLVGSDIVGNAQFGYSVSLSADGNTALIGGFADNNFTGAAWIYTRTNGVWSQQGNKLIGTGAIGDARQGNSVSLSADANTAIIGGFQDNSGVGAAWIFTRSGNIWTQQGNKLIGTGAVGNATQGSAVAINADGNTVIIGGSSDDALAIPFAPKGAAWVFIRNSGVWSQQGNKLVGTGSPDAATQGASVSISADGNSAIVGGPSDRINAGAAWLYKRSSGIWSQNGNKLEGSFVTGNSFVGNSVAMSANGNEVIIGGFQHNGGTGSVWMFTSLSVSSITSFNPTSGPVGTLVTITGTNISNPTSVTIGGVNSIIVSSSNTEVKVMVMPGSVTGNISLSTAIGSYTTPGNFSITSFQNGYLQESQLGGSFPPNLRNGEGYSVAISSDGYTSVIGAPFDNDSIGAAYVYKRVNNSWIEEAKLVGSGIEGYPMQGFSVAISADGNTVLVGGPKDSSTRGAAWIFIRNNGLWSQQGNKIYGTGSIRPSQQGSSVAISADGNTALLGGPYFNVNYYTQTVSVDPLVLNGAAWIFTKNNGVWSQQGTLLEDERRSNNLFNQFYEVSLSADGNTALISSELSVRIYARNSSGTWSKFFMQTYGGTGDFPAGGHSSKLSKDGNTFIIGRTYVPTTSSGIKFFQNRVGIVKIYEKTANNFWQEAGSFLTGNDMQNGASFGTSVDLSADGKTAIVGGPSDNYRNGAVWIFKKDGSSWTQKRSKIAATTVGGVSEGLSVGISADGKTLITGSLISYGISSARVYTLNDESVNLNFSPSSGKEGDTLTIVGSGFSGVTFPYINIGSILTSNFRVIDDNTILAVVPVCFTGNVSVRTTNGIMVSNELFVYTGSGVPSGWDSGLESKSIGDAIGKRIINTATSNKSGVIDYNKLVEIDLNGQTYKSSSSGSNITLSEILPQKLSTGNYKAYTTTPTDIPSFTNAVEALSIDFTSENKARAVAFGTKTLGKVYDHTKAVCDRLKGAELLKIENVTINDINLVKFDLLNSKGQKEYAYSFVIGAKNGRNNYTIQSTWLNKDYSPDETMFNIQLWAESPYLIDEMVFDIITRLESKMPILQIDNKTEIPKTYITKGKCEAENVVLEIGNSTTSTNGYFEILERENEFSTNLIKKQIPFTIKPTGKSIINIPLSDNYEATISLYINGEMKDQVFMADGNWGYEFNSNTTSIKSFKITNDKKRTIENKDDFLLFRNMQIEANTPDNVTVYKLLRGGAIPQDLKEYKTIKLTAGGKGANLRIILLKDSIVNWADQYSLSIPLTSNETELVLSINDFKSKTISGKINANDITTIIFTYEATNLGTSSLMNAQVSNLSFSKTDYAYISSLNSKEINVYPNPASNKFFATFKSPKEIRLNLVVRDAASGRVVLSKWVNAVKGENTVSVDIKNTTGMTNYILNLEGSDIKYQNRK